MDARTAAALLDEFGKLPDRIERPQTFMEIAGYPHYENVCSNFLAFFFDPEGPHGLGSLFLDALMNSMSVAGGEEGLGGNVSVDREVGTAAGNRIDILIQSDSYMVLIENKIFAAAVNPFDDYAAYLDSLVDEDGVAYENKIKVLLTLYRSSEGAEQGFVNLTHADFVSAVRYALGHHVSTADTRYLTLMLDFLNTLENLGEGSRMDREFVALLLERGDEVEDLLVKSKEFQNELRRKVRELESLVNINQRYNVYQRLWRDRTSLFDDLVHDIQISKDLVVAIDTIISPNGWETHIWPRKGDSSNLSDVLQSLRIPLENEMRLFRNQLRFVHSQRFAYDEDLSVIAPVVQDLVEMLSSCSG